MALTSFTSPIKQVTGSDAYLEATKRFFSMIKAVEIKSILVDGERACTLSRYELQAPAGVLDLTPAGRGDFHPQLRYPPINSKRARHAQHD